MRACVRVCVLVCMYAHACVRACVHAALAELLSQETKIAWSNQIVQEALGKTRAMLIELHAWPKQVLVNLHCQCHGLH